MVVPSLFWSLDTSVRVCTRSFASRLDNGSSMRNAAGSRTIARPIATRCRWPPDRLAGLRSRNGVRSRTRAASLTSSSITFLDRRPANLSGGQRQRVAMGRAIVRDPAAFLMDEPLSNLDAKLRVQTRTEVSRLQRRLGTTMVYVTHDQVEALTLGDRVAVMRTGVLQQ